ncbi:hypothetical protein MPSEU_000047600 [Mayamaea pseudoterrestris]|nr:hypothetical protein MPSEU_000047600 [Mayamaea pseudoterrestris]
MSDSSELKAAVQFSVIRCCLEQQQQQQQDGDSRNNAVELSPRAIASLSELTFLFATTLLGPDLDDFRKHANRTKITVDDVKLFVRRNPMLLAQLQAFQERNSHASTTGSHTNTKMTKSTAAAAAITERRVKPKPTARKTAPKKQKQVPLARYENALDSDSDSSVSLAARIKRKDALPGNAGEKKTPHETIELQDSSDSESNDAPASKKQPGHPKNTLSSSSGSSSDGSRDGDMPTRAAAGLKRSKPTLLKRRFRLSMLDKADGDGGSSSEQYSDASNDNTNSRSDSDELASNRHLPPHRSQGVSWRVQQTLDAQGDNSAPSDDD